jgi:flagellar biosynthetic protein FliQ
MFDSVALSSLYQAFYLVMTFTVVLILPSLVVGVLISIFQAATQINEQTLSFAPKLLVMFVTLLFAGSWILNEIVDFSRKLITEVVFDLL